MEALLFFGLFFLGLFGFGGLFSSLFRLFRGLLGLFNGGGLLARSLLLRSRCRSYGFTDGGAVFAGLVRIHISLELSGFAVLEVVHHGEVDLAVVLVDFRDSGRKFVADLESVRRNLDVFGSELGDRNESFETVREFDHDAAVEHTDDLALHFGIDRERCINAVPRIFGEVLHGEGNATLFLVHGENDAFDLVALLDDFARVRDFLRPGHIGNVNESVHAVLDFDECAEGSEVADFAHDACARGKFGFDVFPRISFELLHTERNAFGFFFDLEHHGLDFLTDGENFGRVLDVLRPGHFGNMDEAFDAVIEFDERTVIRNGDDLALDDGAFGVTGRDVLPRMRFELLHAEGNAFLLVGDVEETVYAAEVNERAEVGDVLDDTLADLALLESFENVAALAVAFFFENHAAGHDDVPARLVDLDDLEVEFLADESVDVRDLTEVNLGTGEERVDAEEVDDHAALDALRESAADDFVVFECLADAFPHADKVRFLLGEDETAVIVFQLFDKDFDLCADFRNFAFLEFGALDHAFGLEVDVDEDFLFRHLADSTDGDFACFETVHAGISFGRGFGLEVAVFTFRSEDLVEVGFISVEEFRHIDYSWVAVKRSGATPLHLRGPGSFLPVVRLRVV